MIVQAEDVTTVRQHLSLDDFKYGLKHASPGVFDPRSWAYWNVVCGKYPIPLMPERKL